MRKLVFTTAMVMLLTAVLILVLLAMSVIKIAATGFNTPDDGDGAKGISLLFMFIIAMVFSVAWIVCAINYLVSAISLFCRGVKANVKSAKILMATILITSLTMVFTIVAAVFFTKIYISYTPSLKTLAIATYITFIANFTLVVTTRILLKGKLTPKTDDEEQIEGEEQDF